MIAPLFVPVLISHLRHDRSLGRLGYWYSVAVVGFEAVVILALPLGGAFSSIWHWVTWAIASVVGVLLGIAAWFASEV